jgi:hypothetical protein
MVPQQAQRLRWEDDVDIFLGAIRAEFLMMTNRFYLYLSLPQLWRTRIHLFLSSILSPAHLLLLFTLPMPDDFTLMDPPFRLIRILVWLASTQCN